MNKTAIIRERWPPIGRQAQQKRRHAAARHGVPGVSCQPHKISHQHSDRMTHLFRRAFLTALLFAAQTAWAAPSAAADTLDTWCNDLGKRLRSVNASDCRKRDFQIAPERTSGQRALVWQDIAAAPQKGATHGKTPRVLVIGGIHGDELTSVSIVFRWLNWIDEAAPRRYHWRIIPLANPDGLYQRPPTRGNLQGVDLNRNFSTPDWEKDAHTYWQNRTRSDPRRYPGQSAGSEIETQWLQKQIETFSPDMIISVHAPYNLLDYDGPSPHPLRFGRLALNRLGVYPGSLGNYAGLHKNLPVVTIELPHATSMPTLREQRAMWDDMLRWMEKNLHGIRGN